MQGGGERRGGRRAEARAASDKENIDTNCLDAGGTDEPTEAARKARALPLEDCSDGVSAIVGAVADIPVVKAFLQAAATAKVRVGEQPSMCG